MLIFGDESQPLAKRGVAVYTLKTDSLMIL